MKTDIKKYQAYLWMTLFMFFILSGCSVFKGKKDKKDCDCPSFSQERQDKMDTKQVLGSAEHPISLQ